ncbi:hypothetical protein TL16_g01226 [Triparma laevis f. inornata]|uniref:Uncharacterized protein n=1 Tax=Triparma laevis f. inornata TaxID=1714386 RepID=A0A9W6ZK05_9STRA|nr:hypothetical protein TL16_g01226 [Triparma laevis f. inornata]
MSSPDSQGLLAPPTGPIPIEFGNLPKPNQSTLQNFSKEELLARLLAEMHDKNKTKQKFASVISELTKEKDVLLSKLGMEKEEAATRPLDPEDDTTASYYFKVVKAEDDIIVVYWSFMVDKTKTSCDLLLCLQVERDGDEIRINVASVEEQDVVHVLSSGQG